MPARSRSLTLSNAILSTPLLVPSVSSKGFPFDRDGISESSWLLQVAQDAITDALLISAYDLHHRHLVDAESLLSDGGQGTVLDRPTLLVVDSGGYETGSDFESGHIDRRPAAPLPYDYSAFADVVRRLPDRPLLVVSYDGPDERGGTYEEQRVRAQRFFADLPRNRASDVLLKPEPDEQFHDHRALAAVATDLRKFDVIGFTEKELGGTFLERLLKLARLRATLDEAGVDAPIHLFGALDPLFTPLYFEAGAEIFDGLSWLRYSFADGVAVHPDDGALLLRAMDDGGELRAARRVVTNLTSLSELKRKLERFAVNRDFAEFGRHGEILSEVCATMGARLDRGV